MSVMLRSVVFVALLCGAARARADENEGDVTTARRHFEAGVRYYDMADWQKALEEFMTAQRLHPVPAFDFNIGRCHDFLGHITTAIEHYERYAATNAPDAAQVRARIVELRRRLEMTRPPPPPPPRKASRLAIALGVAGGVVLAGTAVALGVVFGRPAPDYSPSTLGTTRVTP